jgi:hypothetical protein
MKSFFRKYSFPVGYAVWSMVPDQAKKDLGKLLLNPRALSPYIENLPNLLKNRFLDLASLINDPFVATMGLRVLSWEDLKVEISLPDHFQNRDASGNLHIGALSTLAELTARLFWERHLDPKLAKMQVISASLDILNRQFSSVRSLYTTDVHDIESKLFKLRASGELSTENEIQIFDGQKLIAKATIGWAFQQKVTIASSPTPGA